MAQLTLQLPPPVGGTTRGGLLDFSMTFDASAASRMIWRLGRAATRRRRL